MTTLVSALSSLVLPALGCFCCCIFWVFVIILIIGLLRMRKKGKKATPVEVFQEGFEASRAFVRGQKTREQLLAEEDDEAR